MEDLFVKVKETFVGQRRIAAMLGGQLETGNKQPSLVLKCNSLLTRTTTWPPPFVDFVTV